MSAILRPFVRRDKRTVLLADCQSFYASVEKAANPSIRNKPVVVAGDPKRRSGIILAACPTAKAYGVTTAESLRDAVKKCPELVVALPRMRHYIDMSIHITRILESYTELVEPFSIDEQFADVTNSLARFGCNPIELATHIQMRILQETGIYTRIGIAENKILAKIACDIFAKKDPEGGLHEITRDNISDLWSHELNKMFGIGTRTMMHLHKIGIRNIGDLAATPLETLKRKMRVLLGRNADIWSEVLWRTANGIDDSPVNPDAFDTQKGIGRQTTLPVDYHTAEDIHVVLLELSALICERSRKKHYQGAVVSVGVQGADFDKPTGFSRQMKLDVPTNLTREVYAAAKQVFEKHWNGLPVRKVWVQLGSLISDEAVQLTLFDDRHRHLVLEQTMDGIRDAYGPTAVFFGSSASRSAQLTNIARKIGGHLK
ncbi:DNA polymerase-4 [Paenibacillus phyllosphaerae]|uniref:DNA polymerase IV n=1 Tax=Paenibacillus phyllosphaerae TaxID=274593 RepID=A0A7W5AVP9_9BACL|nr:DNA polymerase IV [Paenibacillus phyllosphaerae]MBB3109522.1 DNA polymerase-4 [Paenibacillus phyllosphaerae]